VKNHCMYCKDNAEEAVITETAKLLKRIAELESICADFRAEERQSSARVKELEASKCSQCGECNRLQRENKRLRDALERIRKIGLTDNCMSCNNGITCAEIAKQALERSEG
jgi:predicted nuclease with TOPRIM domain